MIIPAQQGDAFLRDLERAHSEPESLHVWWLGQSGFLVQWQGTRILFDPYLSDSLTRKYAETDKPHERMTERVVAPGSLGGIHVVTASHPHTDHLDPETLQPLGRTNPGAELVFPEAIRSLVEERVGDAPFRLIGLDAGSTTTFGEIEVTGIPAAHNAVERDDAGRCRFLGFVVRAGPWTLYHSGDTLLHDGLVPSLEPFSVDLAFLPINGNHPERRVAGNLDGPEAARLAHAIGARVAIPCHYEMFRFNTASPAAFESTCRHLGQSYKTLRAGERMRLRRPK